MALKKTIIIKCKLNAQNQTYLIITAKAQWWSGGNERSGWVDMKQLESPTLNHTKEQASTSKAPTENYKNRHRTNKKTGPLTTTGLIRWRSSLQIAVSTFTQMTFSQNMWLQAGRSQKKNTQNANVMHWPNISLDSGAPHYKLMPRITSWYYVNAHSLLLFFLDQQTTWNFFFFAVSFLSLNVLSSFSSMFFQPHQPMANIRDSSSSSTYVIGSTSD